MLTSTAIRFMRLRQSSRAAVSLRLFAVIIFVSLFAASAESVKAVSCYSDSWVDDSNPDAGQIVGCGVTHFYYYEPYHDAEVDTTITSPNGRSSSAWAIDDAGGYKQNFNARAEAMLALALNDLGNYAVNSHHYSECPITDFGYTSISDSYLSQGTTTLYYQFDSVLVSEGCSLTCGYTICPRSENDSCANFLRRTATFKVCNELCTPGLVAEYEIIGTRRFNVCVLISKFKQYRNPC